MKKTTLKNKIKSLKRDRKVELVRYKNVCQHLKRIERVRDRGAKRIGKLSDKIELLENKLNN